MLLVSENLQRYFSRYGDVIDCVVMKNSESGRSRGFGFVTFSDPANVSLVLQSGPHQLDGRTVRNKFFSLTWTVIYMNFQRWCGIMQYIHVAVWVASWMFVCSFLKCGCWVVVTCMCLILIASWLKFVRKIYFTLPVKCIELWETGMFFVPLEWCCEWCKLNVQ